MDNFVIDPQAGSATDKIVLPAAEMPSEKEQQELERMNTLEEFRVTTKSQFPSEQPIIMVGGIGALALSDIHAVKAKQKAGKTTVLKVVTSALLNKQCFRVYGCIEDPTIVWLDTEQKGADVKLIIEDVKKLTNLNDEYIDEHLFLYTLRTFSYDTMLTDMELIMKTHNPQIAIIDGIVDFVGDFNDLSVSKDLVDNLLRISTEYNAAVINVLHTNKAIEDHNMRGHLGTMIAQKSGTVLECQKSDSIITVKCTDSRHAPLPDWSIKYGNNGEIMCGDKDLEEAQRLKNEAKAEKQRLKNEETEKKRTQCILDILNLHKGQLPRKELTEYAMDKLELGNTVIKSLISKMVSKGTIYEIGKIIQLDPQAELFVDQGSGDKV